MNAYNNIHRKNFQGKMNDPMSKPAEQTKNNTGIYIQ